MGSWWSRKTSTNQEFFCFELNKHKWLKHEKNVLTFSSFGTYRCSKENLQTKKRIYKNLMITPDLSHIVPGDIFTIITSFVWI